jgi:hypothetical protein
MTASTHRRNAANGLPLHQISRPSDMISVHQKPVVNNKETTYYEVNATRGMSPYQTSNGTLSRMR